MKFPFYVNIYDDNELVDVGKVDLIDKDEIVLLNNYGGCIAGASTSISPKYKYMYCWWYLDKVHRPFQNFLRLIKKDFTNEDFCNLMTKYIENEDYNYKFKITKENCFKDIEL